MTKLIAPCPLVYNPETHRLVGIIPYTFSKPTADGYTCVLKFASVGHGWHIKNRYCGNQLWSDHFYQEFPDAPDDIYHINFCEGRWFTHMYALVDDDAEVLRRTVRNAILYDENDIKTAIRLYKEARGGVDNNNYTGGGRCA